MREALDKIDSLLAEAGTDKTRPDVARRGQSFAEVNKVCDAWAPRAHAPSRSSGQAGWQSREC
jgi:hypothetical protein